MEDLTYEECLEKAKTLNREKDPSMIVSILAIGLYLENAFKKEDDPFDITFFLITCPKCEKGDLNIDIEKTTTWEGDDKVPYFKIKGECMENKCDYTVEGGFG